MAVLDCEQSFFSFKIRGEQCKTSKRASVTVSVTCSPSSSSDACAMFACHAHCSHVTLTVTLAGLLILRSSSRIFVKKRDCSQAMAVCSLTPKHSLLATQHQKMDLVNEAMFTLCRRNFSLETHQLFSVHTTSAREI